MDSLQYLSSGPVPPAGYCDPSPFPPVEVTEANPDYARMLIEICAGGGSSELTAATQYINDYLTIDEPDLAEMALSIALVEVQHLDIIGRLRRLLGGGESGTTLSGRRSRDVALEGTTAQKLRRDIQAEESAIIAYRVLIAEIEDPKVQAVLERILLDEELHLHLFTQALTGREKVRAS